MAFVECDPARLDKLNERARQSDNKDLGFVEHPLDVVNHTINAQFGSKKPYEVGQGFPYSYKPGGNFLHRPLIDLQSIYLGMTWFSMQGPFKPKFCQIMERDFYRCASRVGLQNTEKHCKIYWDDLLECQSHDKSRKRVAYMRKVRNQKQIEPMTEIPYGTYYRRYAAG